MAKTVPATLSKIKPESYPILNETVDTVLYYPRKPVIVTGYTDNRGDVPYNRKLSEARANAVKQYFIQHGVAPWRITTVGMGEADPITTNNTSKGRALNRRIEVEFKKR